jgi:hypothetical protein
MRAVADRGAGACSPADVESLLAENVRLQAELDGLHRALRSRANIEQAKGVLIALLQCTETEAFDVLVQLSQRRNVRLRVLAELLLQMSSAGSGLPAGVGLTEWLREELARIGDRGARRRRGDGTARAASADGARAMAVPGLTTYLPADIT